MSLNALLLLSQIHCYQATLETLLMGLEPPLRRAGLRSVKNAHVLSFDKSNTP